MQWTVLFTDEFEPEFDSLPLQVQDAILARALLLEREGPHSDDRMQTPLPDQSMQT